MIVGSRTSFLRHPLRASLCGLALLAVCASARAASEEPAHSAELDAAIIKQAQRNGVPEKLVRRIVMRESRYNPRARNRSFWGLMQISYPTAKSMGFKGTPQDLLNPIVNLRYAVPYLANAFIIAGKREDAAVRLYASGYYSTAKQRGLLGLLRTAETAPVSGAPDEPIFAAAPPPESDSVFGSLFGAAPAPQASLQTASYGATEAPTAAVATVALPQGKNDADAGVDMSADRSGALHPPRKWLHDGGTTQIARGEQGVEQVAAYEQSNATETPSRGRASHKKTNFAALDQPPANAQAYAATAGGQDLRLTRADSQAAIQQVTSGTPGTPGPGDPQSVAAADPNAPTSAAPEAENRPAGTSRAAHKSHAKGADRTVADKKIADKTPGRSRHAAKGDVAATEDGVVSKRGSKRAATRASEDADDIARSAAQTPIAQQ